MAQQSSTRTMTVAQWIVLVIGVVYVALGVAGFFLTGLDSFHRSPENAVLFFGVSTLLNMLHLLIGLFALGCVRTPRMARAFSGVMILVCAVLLAYGVPAAFIAAPSEPLNTNWQDNLLHLVTALLAIGIQAIPGWTERPDRQHSGA